jgi:luciferase family oxidoreductase group 1
VRVSVLDQTPVSEGSTAAEALRNSIDLARLAERLGYHRYWVAEHHGGALVAGPSPEVLIGPIAAATERMRIGSGGVMLPHYSPSRSPRASASWRASTRVGSTSGSAARPAPTR